MKFLPCITTTRSKLEGAIEVENTISEQLQIIAFIEEMFQGESKAAKAA